ncbi:MAG: hypothetical protein R3F11_05170 [Verrucomicrobiales bacterium]
MSERRAYIVAIAACGLAAAGLAALVWWLGIEGRDAIAERLQAGKRPRVEDHVRTATWWVAACGSGLLALAALTARRWVRAGDPGSLIPAAPLSLPGWRWWLAAGGLLLVAAWMRIERLDLGLYNDEAYMFRRYVAGEFRTDPATGAPRFREPGWETTLWHMEVGNNSPPYSALARLVYGLGVDRFGLVPGEVHEPSIRLPAVAAALAGLLALGWLACRLGLPDRGLLVLSLGAIHPWMVRYGSDGRGHSLLLLWMPLLLIAVIAALRSGRWLPWLAAGGVSALILWTFPGAVPWLVVLNAAIAAGIGWAWVRRPEQRGVARRQAVRWLASNAAAALAFWLAFAPSFSQIRASLGEVAALRGGPSYSWLLDFWGLAGVGMSWIDRNPDSSVAVSVRGEWVDGNALPQVAVALVALAALAGLWRGLRQRPVLAALAAALGIAAPLLAFFAARLTDTVLHPWYAVSALPPLLLLIGMAAPRLADRPDQGSAREGGKAGILAALFVCWVMAVAPQLWMITRHSLQPKRAAVNLVRGGVYPQYLENRSQVRHASFWTDVSRYDPHVDVTWTVEELQAVEQKALAEGVPLFVTFGHRQMAIDNQGELVRYLETSGRYEHVGDLHGTDHAQFNYHVYRWLGGESGGSSPDGGAREPGEPGEPSETEG